MRFTLILPVLAVLATGCQQKEEPKPVERYSGQGRVVELGLEPGMVLIKHSDIPGFMPAMVMMFRLESPELLANVQKDDSIHFTLAKTDSGVVITKVEIIK